MMLAVQDQGHSRVHLTTGRTRSSSDQTETLDGRRRQSRSAAPKAGHHKGHAVIDRHIEGLLGPVCLTLPLKVTIAEHQTSAGAKPFAEHRFLIKGLGSRIDRFWHLGNLCPRGHKFPSQRLEARAGVSSAHRRSFVRRCNVIARGYRIVFPNDKIRDIDNLQTIRYRPVSVKSTTHGEKASE